MAATPKPPTLDVPPGFRLQATEQARLRGRGRLVGRQDRSRLSLPTCSRSPPGTTPSADGATAAEVATSRTTWLDAYRPREREAFSRRAFNAVVVRAMAATMIAAPSDGSPVASAPVTPGSAWRRGGRLRYIVDVDRQDAAVKSLAWRSDSARLALRLSWGNGLTIDPSTGKKLTDLPAPLTAYTARGVLYVPGTDFVVLGGPVRDRPTPSPIALTIVDGASGALLHEVQGFVPIDLEKDPTTNGRFGLGRSPNEPSRIICSPSSGRIVIRPIAGTFDLEAFDPHTWQPERWLIKERTFGSEFDVRPGAAEAAFAAPNNASQVIDLRTGLRTHLLEKLTADVTSVRYSSNGRFLIVSTIFSVSGSIPGRLHVFRCDQDYRLVATFGTEFNLAGSVAIHPDSSIFAVTGTGEVSFFSLDDLSHLATTNVRDGQGITSAFSPDGKSLACGQASDRKAVVLDPVG